MCFILVSTIESSHMYWLLYNMKFKAIGLLLLAKCTLEQTFSKCVYVCVYACVCVCVCE